MKEATLDWTAAIEKNREALKRVLAMLVGMAGIASGPHPEVRTDPELVEGEPRRILPRHLHRAVLSLLRPAEAATRRLIIVAARGLIVPTPRPSLRKPKPTAMVRTCIVMPRLPQSSLHPPAPRTLALSIFDPLPRWGGRPRVKARGVPRICTPGLTERFPIPHPPSPDDPIDATRLNLRLAALGRALDNLPREAKRFARWRAARGAAGAQTKESGAAGTQIKEGRDAGPFRRVWPLRPGRPPGGRRRPAHEVHDILNVVHGLAFWALERPDTS